MQIVWEQGASTVQAVVDALPEDTPLAYSTVLTMLRILEKKGISERITKKGVLLCTTQWWAVLKQGRGALKHLMQRFFDNSPQLLLLNLMQDEELDEA